MSGVNVIECVAGADFARTLTLKDALGATVTGYTAAATLAATVWPGDDQPASFSPIATWVGDASAGQVNLSGTAADTAALDPGDYPILLAIAASGRTAKQVVATLRVLAAPGSGTPPPVACTLDDVQRAAGGIDLRRLAGWADQAGFREQRAEALAWLKRQVMARARRALEDQAARHGPVLPVAPIVPAAGYDAGPAWGPSTIPDTTLRDQERALRTLLDTPGALLVGAPEDGGLARRICALYALAEVLAAQVGSHGDTPYQDLAPQFRCRAVRLLPGWVARIDSDGDGIADYEVRS